MSDPDALPRDVATESHAKTGGLFKLVLGCIGVVYGDIGTSPLYAMRESLHAASQDGLQREDVLGVVSLLIWTLILIVTVKYVILIMRADNEGEGGTLSLVALLQRALKRRPAWLLGMGMVGISLFFGDAIITPAISVLSAVEGLELVAPGFSGWVVPVTMGIIIVLFWVQRYGTASVSVLFGPIMVLWFIVMAVLGLMHVGDELSILLAFNPTLAVGFLLNNGLGSFIVLGSVFLAVTGGEALYADMGHFGKLPIRMAWGIMVFPALTLSYLGQGALVLADPAKAENPFFLMAPEWALLPLVILATAATVIASQAVISGAFSMMQQAVRMGLLPRLEILHTSASQVGQVYLPRVNMILAIGVLILVVLFNSSANLASAYGIAVTGDMVITSILAFFLFYRAWNWPLWLAVGLMAPLLTLELFFLAANATKLLDGGYVPIMIASTMCLMMYTWVRGSTYVLEQSRASSTPMTKLAASLAKSTRLITVPGTAVFLTSDLDVAPAALMHNIKHNHVLHAQNLIVNVALSTRPYVANAKRVTVTPISERFTRISLSFGYMEETNVPEALKLSRRQGIHIEDMTTSYFLNRRSFRSDPRGGLPVWQEGLFVTLTKSAADATDFYHLPANRVVEMGQQLII